MSNRVQFKYSPRCRRAFEITKKANKLYTKNSRLYILLSILRTLTENKNLFPTISSLKVYGIGIFYYWLATCEVDSTPPGNSDGPTAVLWMMDDGENQPRVPGLKSWIFRTTSPQLFQCCHILVTFPRKVTPADGSVGDQHPTRPHDTKNLKSKIRSLPSISR